MRLIQHKKEAYWFYRFVSPLYDRWVNPLFWTPELRSSALALAALTTAVCDTLDVGAGTGFSTDRNRRAAWTPKAVTMLDQSPDQLRRANAKPDAGRLPQAGGRRRSAAVRGRLLRPLRLLWQHRVLARPGSRDRRGTPGGAARRDRSLSSVRCRRGAGWRASWRTPGCSFPRRPSTAAGSRPRGFEEIEELRLAPPWGGSSGEAGVRASPSRAAPATPGRHRAVHGARRGRERAVDGAAAAALRRRFARWVPPSCRSAFSCTCAPGASGGLSSVRAAGTRLGVGLPRRGSPLRYAVALLAAAHARGHDLSILGIYVIAAAELPEVALGDGLADLRAGRARGRRGQRLHRRPQPVRGRRDRSHQQAVAADPGRPAQPARGLGGS